MNELATTDRFKYTLVILSTQILVNWFVRTSSYVVRQNQITSQIKSDLIILFIYY